MNPSATIVQELKELQSVLADYSVSNVYQVPAGYFESLAGEVMRRIRAEEAATAVEELRFLSEPLSSIPAGPVFTVPPGYFDKLPETLLQRVKALDAPDAAAELHELSPLLAGLSRQMPFHVPAGYFADLQYSVEAAMMEDQDAQQELQDLSPMLAGLKKEMPNTVPAGYFDKPADIAVERPQAKVVSFGRRSWLRYAAAAVVTGAIAISGLMLFNRDKGASVADPTFASVVHKMVKDIPTEVIDQFVDETSPVIAKTDLKKDADDVRELIKDIPDEDIQAFLDETRSVSDEAGSSDDILN